MGSNYLTVDGSSTTSSGSSDSLNGLKFGHKIYFGDVGLAVTGKSGGGSSSAADDGGPGGQGAAKKGRGGVVQSGQPPRCQVEGCNVDLSDAKQYYSRHKVCCMHSKSPVVVVGGIEQRFCQQCSSRTGIPVRLCSECLWVSMCCSFGFHQLPEFDQGKRSCRRRLAGHNERRRKPPPGSLLSSRFGRLSSSILDSSSSSSGFIVDFSAYSRASGRNVWPGTEASDHVRGTWPGSSVDPQHDVFLQGTTSGSDFSTDSSCALSLLSNQHWGSSNQPSGVIGSSHLMSVSGAPMAQPGSDHSLVAGHFPPCGTAPGWDHEAEGSSNHLMPDLGHGQVPESHPFQGGLEMAHPNAWHYMETGHSRGYNQSTEHGHWSL